MTRSFGGRAAASPRCFCALRPQAQPSRVHKFGATFPVHKGSDFLEVTAMSKSWALSSMLLLCLAACFTVSCGNSNRRLQSITINGVTNGASMTFTATGNYNRSPMTVTPLPVNWVVQDPLPDYTLTNQPFVVSCLLIVTSVTAMAPADPNAPTHGPISGTKMVVASAPISCQ
jgi:hypothetical protein